MMAAIARIKNAPNRNQIIEEIARIRSEQVDLFSGSSNG
jgi:hypothetical protein